MSAEQIITQTLDEYEGLDSMEHLAHIVAHDLRSAGYLKEPDEVAVPVEALRTALLGGDTATAGAIARESLLARLDGQP